MWDFFSLLLSLISKLFQLIDWKKNKLSMHVYQHLLIGYPGYLLKKKMKNKFLFGFSPMMMNNEQLF